MFKSLLDQVTEQINQLPQLRDQITEQINQTLAPWVAPMLGGSGGEEVQVGRRQLRILSKLGEGGYSFVYLAEELTPPDRQSKCLPRRYALKKVLAGEREQLLAAEAEIQVMKRLPPHPNLMPLLDSQVTRTETPGTASHIIYMLFPLMNENLWDFVQDRLKAGHPLGTSEVLYIFRQLCSALHALHTIENGTAIAHRDVKPHNILLTTHQAQQEELRNADEQTSSSSAPPDTMRGEGDSAHLVAIGSPQGTPNMLRNDANLQGNGLPCISLMDFGSAAPAVVQVQSRSEALALQEQAERHTTAPYRAPELWDVPSNCTVDVKVDIWAAGCVLYYVLVGETPFERTANEAGGSLMLAIVNGRYGWPPNIVERYPAAVRELVDACLNSNPAARPTAAEILEKLDALEKVKAAT